jgi:hypothetical protein
MSASITLNSEIYDVCFHQCLPWFWKCSTFYHCEHCLLHAAWYDGVVHALSSIIQLGVLQPFITALPMPLNINQPCWKHTLYWVHFHSKSNMFDLGQLSKVQKLVCCSSFLFLTLNLIWTILLMSKHRPVKANSGSFLQVCLYIMVAFACGCVIMGMAIIQSGNVRRHHMWMIWFHEIMWGSFQVTLFVLDPYLHNYKTTVTLLSIWSSALICRCIAKVAHQCFVQPKPIKTLSKCGQLSCHVLPQINFLLNHRLHTSSRGASHYDNKDNN